MPEFELDLRNVESEVVDGVMVIKAAEVTAVSLVGLDLTDAVAGMVEAVTASAVSVVGLSAEEATANMHANAAAFARATGEAAVADLDIAAFLRARIDERHLTLLDVGPARVAWATFLNPDGSMRYTSVVSANGDVWVCDGHAVEPDSVRVVFDRDQELADVAAKRMILDEYEGCTRVALADRTHDQAIEHTARAFQCTVSLLALPYAGHPDYQEGWKP